MQILMLLHIYFASQFYFLPDKFERNFLNNRIDSPGNDKTITL